MKQPVKPQFMTFNLFMLADLTGKEKILFWESDGISGTGTWDKWFRQESIIFLDHGSSQVLKSVAEKLSQILGLVYLAVVVIAPYILAVQWLKQKIQKYILTVKKLNQNII